MGVDQVQAIVRYDLRILLPSLPMRQAGPWFQESSHRSLAEAEARYNALLRVAQSEKGSIELIRVRVHGSQTRKDTLSLRAWSFRPHQSAFGLRAWPMDAENRAAVERKAFDLAERANSQGITGGDTICCTATASPQRALGDHTVLRLGKHTVIAAALLVGCAAGMAAGWATATPNATALLAGVQAPRWCLEINERREVVRVWSEYPEMSLRDLAERRQLEGIRRLRGSGSSVASRADELIRWNFLNTVE